MELLHEVTRSHQPVSLGGGWWSRDDDRENS